jgi:hypothetical protein
MINFGQGSFVTEANGDITLQFRWVGTDDLTGEGTVLWSCMLHQLDGSRTIQLGYKLVKDEFSSQFSFDHAEPAGGGPAQLNFPERALRVRDRQIDVTFPADALRGIEPPYWRQWTINVNGIDVATLDVDRP